MTPTIRSNDDSGCPPEKYDDASSWRKITSTRNTGAPVEVVCAVVIDVARSLLCQDVRDGGW